MPTIVEPKALAHGRDGIRQLEFEDPPGASDPDDPASAQGTHVDHRVVGSDGDDDEVSIHSEAVDRRSIEQHRPRSCPHTAPPFEKRRRHEHIGVCHPAGHEVDHIHEAATYVTDRRV